MQDSYDIYQTNHAPEKTVPITLATAFGSPTAKDCVIEYLAFANTHSADIAVTVQSGDGNTFLPGITVTAGTTEVIALPPGGLYFTGGIGMKAATGAKVVAWCRYRLV